MCNRKCANYLDKKATLITFHYQHSDRDNKFEYPFSRIKCAVNKSACRKASVFLFENKTEEIYFLSLKNTVTVLDL